MFFCVFNICDNFGPLCHFNHDLNTGSEHISGNVWSKTIRLQAETRSSSPAASGGNGRET
jgi:hypothetical protein